ncbi:MAG TPA: Twin-arginine translocation pathway signal sequence domain protein, partial [Pirellulales bacterium]|nr:Twin-arginine translocation pathway signal sequence domain protein [Pirellulales bacterium]
MHTRREFLRSTAAGVSFVSLAGGVPGLLTRAAAASAQADRNDHVLVVVELAGGNDGLNTLVPFEDPLYYKNRPTLALAKDSLVKLSDQAGLHPQMAALGELFHEGQLAVVQGVGYPEPDRSHFRSQEIWHTASTDKR